MDTDNVNKKILIGQVGSIRAHKETSRSTNDGRERLVIETILVGWFLNVFHETTENGSPSAETDVKGSTAAKPCSSKDLHKAQVGSLEGINKWLPRRSTAEGGASEKDSRLKLLVHVDAAVDKCLLCRIKGTVTKEYTQGITKSGSKGKCRRVGGVAKLGVGDNRSALPTETRGENLAHSHFSGDGKTVHKRTRLGFRLGRVHGSNG